MAQTERGAATRPAGGPVSIVYLACGSTRHVHQRTWSLAGDPPRGPG